MRISKMIKSGKKTLLNSSIVVYFFVCTDLDLYHLIEQLFHCESMHTEFLI